MSEKDKRQIVNTLSDSASNLKGLAWPVAAVMISFIAVPAVCTLILVGTGVATINGIFNGIAGIFQPQPVTAQVVTNHTLVSSLLPLGQLVSINAEVAKADISVSVHTGGIFDANFNGHSAMHVAQGVVEAGIDMTLVDDSSMDYDAATETYTLHLPASQITSCRIEYIRQYEQNGGCIGCSQDWDEVRMLAQYVSTIEFAEDAVTGGILQRAERETDLLMSNFVASLTGKEVEIVFAEQDGPVALPPSCVPDLPPNWAYDEELQAWVQS